ncbi:Disulfide-bond oxidoreductase YfcG [compost metagenome]
MFAPEPIPAAIDRYRQLTEAAFTTLDGRLTDHEWLASDSYSIADIATFGWTHIAGVGGIDFSHHKHLTRWHRQVAARPAVQRGVTLPEVATAP